MTEQDRILRKYTPKVFMDDPIWIAFGKEAEMRLAQERAENERSEARKDQRQMSLLEGRETDCAPKLRGK